MNKLFLLLVAILSFNVGAADKNEFESITAGFKIVKPQEWQFVTAEQNLEFLKRAELENKELKELMLKHSKVPLVALMKYPEPYDDLNPSIKVNIKPIGKMEGVDSKVILSALVNQLQNYFKDFAVVQQAKDIKISNLSGAYMRADFSLTGPDGVVYPSTSEMWLVPRGEYFFMIGANTRQDEKSGSREEIKKIIDTVVIQK